MISEAKLEELRKKIKEIDDNIIALLRERAQIARRIGEIKEEMGIDVYDPSQERKIFEHLEGLGDDNLPAFSLKAIFREIISASRVLQRPVVVAYLGPEASFAHMAAKSHFGKSGTFVPQPSIAMVFEAVERGKANWGVVPIENSIEGSVNLTLDKLITTDLSIRAEIFLRITHCLMSQGGDLSAIKKVFSHPQALAQCQGWLRANLPWAILVEVESTAAAAKLVKTEEHAAAIASKAAAEVYGLTILAEGIEDNTTNTTRFLVMGRGKGKPTGKDKTSLLFATPHVPGALYKALKFFAEREINMLKIESYPVKDRLWEYLFFVDIAGHREDREVDLSLSGLRSASTFLKILGSYPRCE